MDFICLSNMPKRHSGKTMAFLHGLGGMSDGIVWANLYPFFVDDPAVYTADSYHLSSW